MNASKKPTVFHRSPQTPEERDALVKAIYGAKKFERWKASQEKLRGQVKKDVANDV
ncbi:hypothetical protein SAMN03159463_05870 [Mesorhizobium sp. NFR06]|uniref:hypothetical protein n=1 Tax=Mesorhizobium sp. NFR06 TaxID=1566290 RepID=UPI0008EB2377|nr:hypothetical protein [Mesorhizobium sp. NFR06]SFQ17633.1 hypothetical protein SAMN03159463_05870 [Mesorhizobium sp. NFR06]